MIAVVQIRKEPYYRRQAVELGLKRLGYSITEKQGCPTDHRDLLVLWNRKRDFDEQYAEAWERQGGTVIVMENGYLQAVDKTYYAISTHQHNGAGWFPISDEDRFTKLGFELKPWRGTGDYVLICAQRGVGSKLMASPHGWDFRTNRDLTGKGLRTKIRPHPGNFVAKVPLVEDLSNASVCAIWSSSSGVRALVEGVPVAYWAPHWICAEAAGRQDIHAAIEMEVHRTKALHKMSHGQWHFDEIATGEPFARMRDSEWGPLRA